MRILYDYQAFALQHYGGVSRYFVELARLLSDRDGTEVKIAAPVHLNRYLQELKPGIVYGRRFSRTPKVARHLFNIYNRMATASEAVRYKPDILHETYFSERPIPLGTGQRRVVTVYDMIHERFPELFSRWDPTAAKKRVAVERADHVICISETTRRDLIDINNVRPDKVSVTHLGFDSPRTNETSHESLVDGPYLLYVGHRSGYKNFSRLLEAYAGNRDICGAFKLVCFGGGEFNRTDEREFSRLRVDRDRLRWFGGSDSVLMQLYQHAAAFVYPSLYEGFGIPPLEAMANRCPVICSGGGSISEVVANAGEIFDPCDVASISTAIRGVVHSEQRTAELRALGKARVQCFTWKRCADKTHSIYSTL